MRQETVGPFRVISLKDSPKRGQRPSPEHCSSFWERPKGLTVTQRAALGGVGDRRPSPGLLGRTAWLLCGSACRETHALWLHPVWRVCLSSPGRENS